MDQILNMLKLNFIYALIIMRENIKSNSMELRVINIRVSIK